MTKSAHALSVNLDFLRATAVLSVYLAHLDALLHGPTLGSLGRFGVIIFFVHTSFVLMASLQRLQGEAASDTSLALAFWIRRLFRIYPLAILCVALVTFFHVPANPGQVYSPLGFGGILANLALSQNLIRGGKDVIGPLWSLPLEVQMYALLPFAYFAIRGNVRYRSLALWILSVLLALTVPHVSVRLKVFLYGPCFMSGIVAFDLMRSKSWSWKLPSWAWPLGVIAIIASFGPHDDINLGAKIHRAWMLSLLLGCLYANTEEGTANRLHDVAHWIAERSYGIYLSHVVVFWTVVGPLAQSPTWMKATVLIAGSLGIPTVLYVCVEKPLIQAGGQVANRALKTAFARLPLVFSGFNGPEGAGS